MEWIIFEHATPKCNLAKQHKFKRINYMYLRGSITVLHSIVGNETVFYPTDFITVYVIEGIDVELILEKV